MTEFHSVFTTSLSICLLVSPNRIKKFILESNITGTGKDYPGLDQV